MRQAQAFLFLMLASGALLPQSVSAKTFEKERVLSCMQQLPQTIVINEDMRDLTFNKATRMTSFYNYEEQKAGAGFRQDYQSNLCFAGVYLYDDNMGRLSNNKVQRALRDTIEFPQKKQQSFRKHKVRFYGASGFDKEVGTSLIIGDYHNNFLKIRVTCPLLPDQTQNAFLYQIDEMSQKIAHAVTGELNACLIDDKK